MSEFDLRHALAVAGRVDGLEAKMTALLHDAIEDAAISFENLRQAEIPESIVIAVDILTRTNGESYEDYIARVRESCNDLAIYVKLADLEANLARMDDEHHSLTGRYRAAEKRLRET